VALLLQSFYTEVLGVAEDAITALAYKNVTSQWNHNEPKVETCFWAHG